MAALVQTGQAHQSRGWAQQAGVVGSGAVVPCS